MSKIKSRDIGVTRETSDYSLFKTHPINREIKEAKVKQLIKIMKIMGWLPGSYIIVDKYFVIINGQHRFIAAQILKIPVQYVQLSIEATPELIRMNNMYHMNWSLEDTLHGFAAEGNENYVELDDFKKRHPELKFTDVMMIAKTSTRSAYREELESGNFKMKDPKMSEEWACRVKKFEPFVEDYNQRSFVRSLVKVFVNPVVNFDELMRQAKKYPGMLRNYKQMDRNLEMFQALYNKGKGQKNRINLKKL